MGDIGKSRIIGLKYENVALRLDMSGEETDRDRNRGPGEETKRLLRLTNLAGVLRACCARLCRIAAADTITTGSETRPVCAQYPTTTGKDPRRRRNRGRCGPPATLLEKLRFVVSKTTTSLRIEVKRPGKFPDTAQGEVK